MGGFSLWHWLVVIILVMLLFGRGRISDMMGDIGKGLKSFKEGMSEEDKKRGRPARHREQADRRHSGAATDRGTGCAARVRAQRTSSVIQ